MQESDSDNSASSYMPELFPEPPFIPAVRHDAVPVCEWVVPVPSVQQRDYFRVCKVLPAGMPDFLEVSIDHSEQGTERCTAVVYGNRAYLIHYHFEPRRRY